jgi:sirohydrochlorin cobaltochelatase
VSDDQFGDAALVLLGHGSSTNERAGQPVFEQARRLRAQNRFAEVREAFWKQEPQVKDVLAELTARRVFIVPLFVSEGYFSENVIPNELGFNLASQRVVHKEGQSIYYCKPVGSHPDVTDVILDQALGIIDAFPFPRKPEPLATSLFVAGHGTERDSESRKAMEWHASRIRDRKIFADCQAIFLEEKPGIADCYGLAQTRNIVVVPLLIGEGDHTEKDIPRMLGEAQRIIEKRLADGQPPWRNPTEKQGKLVWYASSLGLEPRLANIIWDRVEQAIKSQGPSE